jgi:hypothetical protein
VLAEAFNSETWHPAEYTFKEVWEPKHRLVAKASVPDHVMLRTVTDPIEQALVAAMYPGSYSCVKGRGTHAFMHALERELWNYPAEETRYGVQLDVHHYFPSINHELMKERLRWKVKDRKVLAVLDAYIDSYNEGLPLGVKCSQMLSYLYLTPFDWAAKACFYIGSDPEKMAYWRSRYVSDKLLTCRTEADARELRGGVTELSARFDAYVHEGLRHYMRFADNIVILHRDKTFLHLMVELSQMIITRDYLLSFNSSYNVRPVDAGGLDVCGYVFFHGYTRLRKRNKQALCRQVARLRKRGLPEREVRLRCASRVGFAGHADTKHLLTTMDLGQIIKEKRRKMPWPDMTADQKESIEQVVCHRGESREEKVILLTDYIIDNSVLDRKGMGDEARKRIIIRYRHARLGGGPNDWEEMEHYAFSGSQVLIDQATRDFSPGDLPAETVIEVETNHQGGKFYKFT